MTGEFTICCVTLKELETQLTPQPRILIDNAPDRRHTVESLSYKAAEAYHRFKNKEKMIAALERLPNLRERTEFLIHKSYIEEAAKMFQEAGVFWLVFIVFRVISLSCLMKWSVYH